MRAVADQLPVMQCPQHRLVALVGTGKLDGSASFYDVIIRVSDTVRAAHYPLPLPVIARSRLAVRGSTGNSTWFWVTMKSWTMAA